MSIMPLGAYSMKEKIGATAAKGKCKVGGTYDLLDLRCRAFFGCLFFGDFFYKADRVCRNSKLFA